MGVSIFEENIPIEEISISNYPNQFNPTTTISFKIINSCELSQIEIHNLKGQKIKTLSLSSCHPEFIEGRGENNYSVIWDGTDSNDQPVSSEIYFYKMKLGNYTSTKKMILMK
ncbi:MAG: hypothetical protein P9M11_00280 [Candidatus Tenebribacter burtonii]|jgi:hypothetical protein|nr:hypothetical protein [Candidatus Tenebribacter burtonii]